MSQCAEVLLGFAASLIVAWLFHRHREASYNRMEQEIFGDVGGYRNKWERMTGKPCRPHDRTGLPTSPPPPRRRP